MREFHPGQEFIPGSGALAVGAGEFIPGGAGAGGGVREFRPGQEFMPGGSMGMGLAASTNAGEFIPGAGIAGTLCLHQWPFSVLCRECYCLLH